MEDDLRYKKNWLILDWTPTKMNILILTPGSRSSALRRAEQLRSKMTPRTLMEPIPVTLVWLTPAGEQQQSCWTRSDLTNPVLKRVLYVTLDVIPLVHPGWVQGLRILRSLLVEPTGVVQGVSQWPGKEGERISKELMETDMQCHLCATSPTHTQIRKHQLIHLTLHL